ncbi:lactonase family protein [Gemmatimonas sp.]|uniref:lactonase family protein n=1 Tax=Gemmatimonas sp. TaxID=1962908 RepID=UPI003DA60932
MGWRLGTEATGRDTGELYTRRGFLAVSAIAAVACVDRTQETVPDSVATRVDGSESEWSLFVGTDTKSGTSTGIYRTTVNARTLAFGAMTLAAETADPSYLAFTPNHRVLIAVNELLAFEGNASGAVSAFRHDAATGTLTAVPPMRSSRGGAPCYVHIDRSGRYALVASYVGGRIAMLPIAKDGSLGNATASIAFDGHGPHAARQESSHTHCILLDAENRFAYVADLGTDRIHVFAFDAASGTLTPAERPFVSLAPGAGPRHLAFSTDGRTLYCVNELDSTLAVFACDAQSGLLQQTHVVSTRPPNATGNNAPADLHVHPTNGAVYLSNRGDNTVVVFDISPSDGRPTLGQAIASGGDWPRNFTFTPDGNGLLVAHQRSNTIVAFRINATSGRLSSPLHTATVPVPVCLLFA